MPFIETKTNVTISAEMEESIRAEFGKAIELIRGKSEYWLMLSFEGNKMMAFRGSSSPCAMVEVKIFGSASDREYSALTARLTEIVSNRLSISPDRIYVKYDEVSTWGLGGENF